MSPTRLIPCCLAASAVVLGGCAGPWWLADVSPARRAASSPFRLGSEPGREKFAVPSAAPQPPEAAEATEPRAASGAPIPTLSELLVDVEKLRQQNPADYAVLKRALEDTQGQLPPPYEQLFQSQLMALALQRQLAQASSAENAPTSSPAAALAAATSGGPPALETSPTTVAIQAGPAMPASYVAPATAAAPVLMPAAAASSGPTSAEQTSSQTGRAVIANAGSNVSVQAPEPPTALALAGAPPPQDQVVSTSASLPAAGDKPATVASEAVAAANDAPAGSWREMLRRAVETLEAESRRPGLDSEEKGRLQTYRRLLQVLNHEREAALAAIEELPEDEQAFWKHQLYALLVALDAEAKHAASRRAALALRELRQAEHYLANISTLDVKNLALCSEAISYGEFKEFASYTFRANQQVVLYVEVENFAAHSKGDRYETELHGSYEIFDEANRRVANVVLAPDRQVSQNRRRDYFIGYLITLPSTLQPGSYRLQLTIEDVIGKKSNQASLDFRIR